MAEIAGDEAPTVPPPHPHISGDQCTSTPASTGSSKPPLRTTKPGVKRLILTASVLLSFLLGLPFLLKSTEIHHSLIPSDAITALAHRLGSTPPSFPCGLHAVFLW
ncbi:GPI transamidase component PIG-S-related [Zea mays]|uniref:GPI transamidase component PIG-S-related n=1 Tax=Zea mays TaxID=4577 RepID=A0A1D6N412_MAIZE|nr:GPI transamidase component PIG-S-related [Zea mays]